MNAENNPYRSPHDVDRAWYDHRLFWRVVKFTSYIVTFGFDPDGVWTTIQSFVFDWDAVK